MAYQGAWGRTSAELGGGGAAVMPSVLPCPGCGTPYPIASPLPASGSARCRRCQTLIPLAPVEAARPPAKPEDATDRTVVVGRIASDSPLDLPPGTRVSLAVLDGPDQGKQFRITKARTVVGRREGEVRLADPEVSGRHAALTVRPEGCTIEDLQSTNGTLVNGARVTSTPLAHLDELHLGRTRLLFSIVQEGTEPEGAAPAVEEQPRVTPKRLLVVEGSELFRRKLLAALKGLEAVTVEVAGDAGAGAEALAATRGPWDLLLVDLHLPAGPAEDVLATLRVCPAQDRPPLVGSVGLVGMSELLQVVAGLLPVGLLDKAQPPEALRTAIAAALARPPVARISLIGITGLTVRCSVGRTDLQGLLVGLGSRGARLTVPEVPEADSHVQLMFILPEVPHLFRVAGRVTNREWPRPGVAQGTIDVQFLDLDPEARSKILAFLLVDARRRAAARTAEIGQTG